MRPSTQLLHSLHGAGRKTWLVPHTVILFLGLAADTAALKDDTSALPRMHFLTEGGAKQIGNVRVGPEWLDHELLPR